MGAEYKETKDEVNDDLRVHADFPRVQLECSGVAYYAQQIDALPHYCGGAKEHQCRLGASRASRRITVITLIYDGLGNVMATTTERSMRCPGEP